MQLKSSTKRFASALAATLALVACGDDDTAPMNTADGGLADQGIMTADSAVETDGSTSPDMGTANEISFDDLPAAVADAWCNRIECFGELGDDFFSTLILGGGSDDPVVCRARLTRVLSGMLSVEEEGYDPRAAFDCVETIRNPATECADVIEPNCPALEAGSSDYHGDVALGGECESSLDCDVGLRCDRSDAPDFRCAGTCQTGLALGESCDNYDDCSNIADTYVTCDLASSDAHSPLYICVRTAYENTRAEGESCTEVTLDEATSTLTTNSCARGLDCRGNECTKTEAGLGEDCTELECGEALTCSAEGDTAGTCQPLFSFAFEAGDDCGLVAENSIVFCDFLSGATGYVCDITDDEAYTGTCVAVGDGSLGSVCLAFEELGFTCDEGLFCATEYREGIFAGRCTAKLAAGLECNDGDHCLSGLCEYDSAAMTSVCLPNDLADGASCQRDGQCASNYCAPTGPEFVCAPLECTPDL